MYSTLVIKYCSVGCKHNVNYSVIIHLSLCYCYRNRNVATNIVCVLKLSLMNVSIFCSRALIISKSWFKTSGVIRRKPWQIMVSTGINSFKMKWPWNDREMTDSSISLTTSWSLPTPDAIRFDRYSRFRRRRFMIINTTAAAANRPTLILSHIFV